MNFKHLFSGVLAMVVAISTVFAFSGQLTALNGAYFDPQSGHCRVVAADCSPNPTDEECMEAIIDDYPPVEIYENAGPGINAGDSTLCGNPLWKIY